MQGGYWTNEPDGSQLVNMDNAFLPEHVTYSSENFYGKDYLVYAYSDEVKHWELKKVSGQKQLLYIYEAPIANFHNLIENDRSYQFGIK